MGERNKEEIMVPRDSVPEKESFPAHIYRILFTDSSGKKREYRFYVRNQVCTRDCERRKNVPMEAASFVSSLRKSENAGTLNFEFGTEDNYGRIFEYLPGAGGNGGPVEVGRIHSLSCKEVLQELLDAREIEVIYEGKEDVMRNRLDCPDVIRKKRKAHA